MHNLKAELTESILTAREAGKIIMQIYHSDFHIDYKEDASPVTLADHKANDLIVNRLKSVFPSYAILSEESKDDRSRLLSDWCFIVDPLDGTKEFIKRNGEFTVNIALVFKKKPVMGVVFIPETEELYYAIKGQGAFYEKNNHAVPIDVSDKIEKIRAACSRSHTSGRVERFLRKQGINELIFAGSAIKGCLIARGEAEIYYRFGYTSEWDTAALQCIVEEAGGIFKQMDDSEMVYNRENTLNEKGFYILNRIENKLNIEE